MARIDHKPFVIRVVYQRFENLLPYAFIPPSAKPLMNGAPFSVVWRQITPWRSGAKNPEHSVDKSAVVLSDAAPLPSLSRQHWL